MAFRSENGSEVQLKETLSVTCSTVSDTIIITEPISDPTPKHRSVVIRDHNSLRWFKSVPNQFLSNYHFYKNSTDTNEYIPGFVTETDEVNLIIEVKAANKLDDKKSSPKKDAALK